MPSTAVYVHQRGELRIYDGTATPNYLVIPFAQPDGRFPIARARPEQNLRLNRGRGDTAGYQHYTSGPDDPIFAPPTVTLTAWADEQLLGAVLAALCNPFRDATWTVGDGTFTTAAGTGRRILNGAGTLVPVPQPDDPEHDRVHVEWLYQGAVAGTNDRHFRHEECYFPPDQQVWGEGDPCALSLTYMCYGDMATGEAFTAGTDISPALT